MSLYNALFGVNPFSRTLLAMLGTDESQVPRYRDCFLSDDGAEIIIHTRTGGGNRDFYENEARCRDSYPEYFDRSDAPPSGPWNDDLRSIAGFIRDVDDDFDSTYADFHYAIPPAFKEQVALLSELGAISNPAQKWQSLLDGLRAQDMRDPTVKRAIDIGEQIMTKINTAMRDTP